MHIFIMKIKILRTSRTEHIEFITNIRVKFRYIYTDTDFNIFSKIFQIHVYVTFKV